MFMFTNPMSDKVRHFTTFNYEAITYIILINPFYREVMLSLGIWLPVFRASIVVLSARVKMSTRNYYCSWTVANLRRTDASSTLLQKPENSHDISLVSYA
jgi:hypothetical protein